MKSCIYASGFNKKDSILRINNGDRSLKARKNILAMFIIKGLSISITFAYVPLLIKILTTEIYGVWITLVSFIGWLSYFDVGLGHGLRNKFGEAIALHEVNNARSYVSTAYIIMTFVAVILLIAQFCLFPLIDWAEVLNAPQDMTKELNSLVLFIGTLTSLQLVIKLITSILLALQKPASSALIVALGQIITFILVFTLVKLNITTTIVDLGVVITLVPIVVLTLFSAYLFSTKLKQFRPHYKYFNPEFIKPLLNLGLTFFLVQLISLILFQTNNLIIAHTCGSKTVAEYDVAFRYIGVVNMVFYIIITPYWSATTEAYNKRDFVWIRKSITTLNKIWLMLILLGFLMITGAKVVYRLWIGDAIPVSYLLLFLILLYFSIYMRWSLYGSILNGIGKIRAQLVFLSLEALIHIPLAFLLGKKIGITGVIISMIITSSLNVIWPPIQLNRLLQGRAYGIWNR